MPTVGEALVERLKAHGVSHVFGIPGVHTVELYRGLASLDVTGRISGIKFAVYHYQPSNIG